MAIEKPRLTIFGEWSQNLSHGILPSAKLSCNKPALTESDG